MEIIKKAEAIIKDSKTISLASVSPDGYPRICVVSKTNSEGIKKLYATTGMVSTKVKHFTANPKASACICVGGDSITLVGTLKVTQDPEVLKNNWLDWFDEHYKGIDDPNYCVLEFTAQEATLWINGEFATVGKGEIK